MSKKMNKIQAWWNQVSGKSLQNKPKNEKGTHDANPANNNHADYFELARSWADDYYTVMRASRNRYRLFLGIAVAVCITLVLAIIPLAHNHEYVPLLVHHYDSGVVSVDQADKHTVPESQAEIESELVRYLVNRESYDPTSFTEQYQLVTLMSDSSVARDYHQAQNSDDQTSLIATLGNKFVRTVKVQSLNFLDKESLNQQEKHHQDHKNLAEVNFIVTDKNVKTGTEIKTPYVAIVSWTHEGIPNDPETRWMNWNGFTVTHYQRNQRTL